MTFNDDFQARHAPSPELARRKLARPVILSALLIILSRAKDLGNGLLQHEVLHFVQDEELAPFTRFRVTGWSPT
jgi:hypothetical protein